jgi:hypothetical protein
MHIDDEPSFLAGNGLPYEFASGEESGPVEANVSSPTAVSFGPIGAQHRFIDDYAAANALVPIGPANEDSRTGAHGFARAPTLLAESRKSNNVCR